MASHNNGGNGNNGEPSSAPQSDTWYNLRLGSSFKDHSPTKFCLLRYEFKPASIDKSQAGSLHKNKESRVTVEFHNNQPGKPKVTFEGSGEDYKDNDGVLFFDGETFRLERLHRTLKPLKHLRLPGESAVTAPAVASASSVGTGPESRSPPIGKMSKPPSSSKAVVHSVPVEVERIEIGEPESTGVKPTSRSADYLTVAPNPPPRLSLDRKANEEEGEKCFDLVMDDDDEEGITASRTNGGGHVSAAAALGFDMNLPNNLTDDTDEEIADVDVSDDEGEKGPNAAAALRAQVNAEEGQRRQTSSSGTSSGTESSGSSSGSGSSSSDSEGSADESASSAGDLDIG